MRRGALLELSRFTKQLLLPSAATFISQSNGSGFLLTCERNGIGLNGYKTASYNQQRPCIMYNFGTRLRGFGAMFNAHLQAV